MSSATNTIDKKFGQNDPKIVQYAEQVFVHSDPLLNEVAVRSEKEGLPVIQVSQMDGLHLEVIARSLGARKIVEIGTLGGYSGICFLRALQPGGKLYTFEGSAHHAKVAAESFKKAGFSDRVEIFVGTAIQNLPKIEQHGPFDLVFIDADKVSYPAYLDWAAKNLRVGGTVLADNTFAFGLIADEHVSDPKDKADVEALREFNQKLADPKGVFRATILPTGEGLSYGVKIRA
jgi:caffeoyl-CoA O-methyltransferase